MRLDDPPSLSLSDVRRALEDLYNDDVQMSRLMNFAIQQARKTRYGHGAAEDLIHEAFERFWRGSRTVKPSDKLIELMYGAIRSIADEWMEPWHKPREAGKKVFQRAVPDHPSFSQENNFRGSPNNEPRENPENDLRVSQETAEIVGLFESDLLAKQIVLALIDRAEREEIIDELNISEVTYASKRRLIRRRIDQYFEGAVSDD